MRRVLVVVALAALTVTSAAAARPAAPQRKAHGHPAGILGTWSVQVKPKGAPSFAGLVTFTQGGGLIETESDQPGTGQGSWHRIAGRRFAFAFESFIFSPTGPAGHVVVRGRITLRHGTLSGPFKFDVFDTAGHIVQSGSGTASGTRFAIPSF
jgi:hypothetical protein